MYKMAAEAAAKGIKLEDVYAFAKELTEPFIALYKENIDFLESLEDKAAEKLGPKNCNNCKHVDEPACIGTYCWSCSSSLDKWEPVEEAKSE